jgi:hypothetical protein
MNNHPELGDDANELIKFINASQITLVRCHGCGVDRPINSNYANYCRDGIQQCRFCRGE